MSSRRLGGDARALCACRESPCKVMCRVCVCVCSFGILSISVKILDWFESAAAQSFLPQCHAIDQFVQLTSKMESRKHVAQPMIFEVHIHTTTTTTTSRYCTDSNLGVGCTPDLSAAALQYDCVAQSICITRHKRQGHVLGSVQHPDENTSRT